MLSICKLGGGQHRYDVDKVAEGAEDYYSGEGEAPGCWLGQGAHGPCGQGRARPSSPRCWKASTLTGEPHGLKSAPGREAVPGFDLTLLSAEVRLPHPGAQRTGCGRSAGPDLPPVGLRSRTCGAVGWRAPATAI